VLLLKYKEKIKDDVDVGPVEKRIKGKSQAFSPEATLVDIFCKEQGL